MTAAFLNLRPSPHSHLLLLPREWAEREIAPTTPNLYGHGCVLPDGVEPPTSAVSNVEVATLPLLMAILAKPEPLTVPQALKPVTVGVLVPAEFIATLPFSVDGDAYPGPLKVPPLIVTFTMWLSSMWIPASTSLQIG